MSFLTIAEVQQMLAWVKKALLNIASCIFLRCWTKAIPTGQGRTQGRGVGVKIPPL